MSARLVASRSSAQSLANSVFALTGLSLAVISYAADLDKESEFSLEGCQGHVSYTQWVDMVINSLLVLSSSTYEPTGQFIVLGNQVNVYKLTCRK